MKGENDSNILTIGVFNIPHTPMDRSFRQKINKERQAFNDMSDQLDVIYIYSCGVLSASESNDPIKKWAKEVNRHFSKEDI